MLIKDLWQDYAGVRFTSGCNAYKRANAVAKEHSEIVSRYLAAGVVVFGRTNAPEFGAKGITEPDAWPATRNPWSLAHSPGGSSGGSAAAVAARIVPIAGANDGGGSIRIPAACTGLFGLKPGRGRTPCGPELGEMMHGAAINHVLTRSVRDSAVMLDATHGSEVGSWMKLAPPERPYAEEVERAPRPLRIAFSTRSPIGTQVDADIVAAIENTARLLASLGHHVEEAAPAIDGRQFAKDFSGVWFAHLASNLRRARRDVGARNSDFELDSLAMEAMANAKGAVDYVEHYVRWNGYGRALAEHFERFDVYMTPTLGMAPPRIGEVKTPPALAAVLRAAIGVGLGRLIPLAADQVDEVTIENLRRVPFTQLANLTGVPAMSVPLHTHENGLPLGVQFLAGHGGEGLLFSLAGQLERALPWAHRMPQLPA